MLNNQIDQAEQHLATVLPDTPAGVLTSLPGVGVVRASNYGGALGDPRACQVVCVSSHLRMGFTGAG